MSPASFLSLSRELRQPILIQSYTFEESHDSPWTFAKHKADIAKWKSTLHSAFQVSDLDMHDDIEYANEKWMKAMELEAGKQWTEKNCTSEQRKAIWTTTRGGTAPWAVIKRKLYIKNRQWWYEGACTEYYSRRRLDKNCNPDVDLYPPWDPHARSRSVDPRQPITPIPGWIGPSGVTWDSHGEEHGPETWDQAGEDGTLTLMECGKLDAEWLARQVAPVRSHGEGL
ncbi:hypothetical protein FKW77_009544 [Venturia effusa]|uniref:Uncharacterized protein n=1 Tax=Venturia effusa TaxID=50376 RepID=A0A517LEL8_9PEZI|nr:hypothetical protein FKW77_009544 [Venturia effusa]